MRNCKGPRMINAAKETAVHCCNSALSVLVMLVSESVFHVLSALQSIVCLYFLELIVHCFQDNQ